MTEPAATVTTHAPLGAETPSMRSPATWLRLALGLLVSAGAIVVVAWRADLADVRAAMSGLRYEWLLPAILLSFATIPLRTLRWQRLFHPQHVPFGRVLGILTIGQAISALAPFRLGDLARVYLLGELEHRGKAWTLATIALERLLDILTLVLILFLLVPFAPVPAWARQSALLGMALSVVMLGAMAVAWRFRERALARRWPSLPVGEALVARVRALIGATVDGLAVLSAPRALGQAALSSLLIWLLSGLVLWTVMPAFGIPASLSTALLVLVVSAVAIAIPLAPGAVGVYHAAVVEALVLTTDVPPATATSYAIVTHLLLFGPPVICGLCSVWRMPVVVDWLTGLARGTRRTPAVALTSSPPAGD